VCSVTPVSGLGGSDGPGARRRGAAATAVLLLLGAACGNDWGRSAETATPGSSPPADENGANGGDGDTSPGDTNPDEHVPVDAPGVTDTEIRVGGVVSVTNPLGGGYGDAFEGVQAYFDMVNSAGGIYGRRLVIASKRDDNLANNRSEVQGLITQDSVFAALPMAALLFQGADLLVREQIPTFGWTINAEWSSTPADPRPNLFGQAGSYLGFANPTPVLPWLAQEIGAHQIGVLAYNVAAQ
jgi:branched-chain amino acid transport system substrate-binding protein